MKEVDLISCKDCKFFARWQLKADWTEDLRYKKNYCMLHDIDRDADDFCSDAVREEKI